jgi:hypothetical protein
MSSKAISTGTGTSPLNGFDALYPGTSQALAVAGTSAQSAAVGGNTTIVRIYATQDCWVALGPNPTAAANTSMFLAAGAPEYLAINPGEKIAAIQASAAGSLYISEGK